MGRQEVAVSPAHPLRSGHGWVVALALAMGGACAGAPWFLGDPLDGKAAIPPTSHVRTVADHRRQLDEARRHGEKVIELAALMALEQRGALHGGDTSRLLDLLKERARDWIALKRPIPLAADLRHMVALDPTRARPLARALRAATRAAGDTWLALGENARAEEEYRQAERLGAPGMLFRLRAAWGASPGDLDRAVLEEALAALPERALAPFTMAYLDSASTEEPPAPRSRPLLRRAWTAARVYGPAELRARLQSLPELAIFEGEGEGDVEDEEHVGGKVDGPSTVDQENVRPAKVLPAATPLVEPGFDARLYGGATLSRALLPSADAFPQLSAPGARSREWADRLLDEDPTAPDSLEFAALVDARAGRVDGAARKLVDLVFYSPDRASAYARAARVWERSGEGRRACLAWERAAHLGAADDPRWCDLIRCLDLHAGAGDSAAVVRHLRARAPHLSCGGRPVTDGRTDAAGPDGGIRDVGPPDGARPAPP